MEFIMKAQKFEYAPKNPVAKAFIFASGMALAGVGLGVAKIISLGVKAQKMCANHKSH
jgi:hypothetical protein